MKSKKVTLPNPIKRRSSTLKTVTLNEPSVPALTGLEITAVVRGDTQQLCILLQRISELTETEVKKLSFKNIAKLSMEVTTFLGD